MRLGRGKNLKIAFFTFVLVVQSLGLVLAPSAGILFEEHFNYPDGTAPPGWKVLRGGPWSVESGEYSGAGKQLSESIVLHDPSWSSYRLRAKIRVIDYPADEYPYVGLLVRHGTKELAGGELRAYAFDVDPWVARIILYVNGMPKDIGRGRGGIKAGVDYNYAFEAEGNVFRGYINGVKVVEATDPDSTWMNGVIGLRAWGTHVHYDDVVVETMAAQYTLTISTTPGGTTNPNPGSYTCDSGSTVSVTALPDTGYKLDHWELDGANVGATNSYSVNMAADHSLRAVFSPLSIYSLMITATTGGTTDPVLGEHAYNEGNVATVTAIADSGYFFHHWELDGANAGSTNPIQVTMNTNHSLRAVFSNTPPVLFEDHFDYPDGIVQPDGWRTISGKWAVEAGEYSQSNMKRGYKDARAGDPSWTDYSLQVNIKFMDVPTTELYSAGLYFRYSDLNFYYIEMLVDPVALETYLEVAKIVDGSWFKIARVKLSGLPSGVPQTGVFYSLRVEVTGSTIRGYLNGALIIQTFDSTFINGQIGLFSFGCHAHFDDVVVEMINP